jgi:large subunit ribosomal protein L16
MLMPKKVKYRKSHRGRMKGLSKGARTVDFGEYGLCAIEPAWVSSRQIESMRVALSRGVGKEGAFFVRVFPDKPVSKKPLETRMGKGKPNPEFWVAVVKRGRVVAEVKGVAREAAKKILQSVAYKLPMKTRFVEAQPRG